VPMFFGIVLGVLLTVGGAFVYDTTTGRTANGLSSSVAAGRPPLVNWDVVNDDWLDLRKSLGDVGAEVEQGWRRLTSR
jgi:hypothetical protein